MRVAILMASLLLGWGLMSYIHPLLPAAIALWHLGSSGIEKYAEEQKKKSKQVAVD